MPECLESARYVYIYISKLVCMFVCLCTMNTVLGVLCYFALFV